MKTKHHPVKDQVKDSKGIQAQAAGADHVYHIAYFILTIPFTMIWDVKGSCSILPGSVRELVRLRQHYPVNETGILPDQLTVKV